MMTAWQDHAFLVNEAIIAWCENCLHLLTGVTVCFAMLYCNQAWKKYISLQAGQCAMYFSSPSPLLITTFSRQEVFYFACFYPSQAPIKHFFHLSKIFFYLCFHVGLIFQYFCIIFFKKKKKKVTWLIWRWKFKTLKNQLYWMQSMHACQNMPEIMW